MNEQFKALHLRVVELPIEFTQSGPLYGAYLRELPIFSPNTDPNNKLSKIFLLKTNSKDITKNLTLYTL